MCGSLRCAPADDRVLSASRLGCAPGRGAHRSGAADGCRGVYCGGVCRSPRRLRFTPLGPDHAVSLAAAPSGLGHPSGLGLRPRQFPFRLGHPSNLGLCSRRPACSLGHPSNLGLSPRRFPCSLGHTSALGLLPRTHSLRLGTFRTVGDFPARRRGREVPKWQGSPRTEETRLPKPAGPHRCRPPRSRDATAVSTGVPARRQSPTKLGPSRSQPDPPPPAQPSPARPSPAQPRPAQPSQPASPRHPTSASASPAPGPRPAAS